MASTGAEAVRFSPRLARLGPLLRHARLTGACGALSLPARFKRAVPDECWCMELVASKTASWAFESTVGHQEKRSELALALDDTTLDKVAEVGWVSTTCSTRETTVAEVGAAGSTCAHTTRVLENWPSLTVILLLLARVNKEIPDDDRLAEGGLTDSKM